MTLIANSAVTVGGKSYRPGDIIDCSADSKEIQRLVHVGYAVQHFAPGEVPGVECLTIDTAEDNGDGTVTGTFNRDDLESMSKAELQKLAADLGIDNVAELTKAKLVDAIASVKVDANTEESE